MVKHLLAFVFMVAGMTACTEAVIKANDIDTFNKKFLYSIHQFTALVDTANAMIDNGLLVAGSERFNKIAKVFQEGYDALEAVKNALRLKDYALAQDKQLLMEQILIKMRTVLMEGQENVRYRSRACGFECHRYSPVWT